VNEFSISPAHFVERHGLIIIIALGESIVAIGVGATGLVIDVRLLVVVMLGLTLSYLMWWVYFGEGEGAAERALAAVDPARRGRVAVAAYGWAHYFLLLGIIAVAAGVKKAIGHGFDHLTLGQSAAIAGGVACYLLGDVAFRRALRIGVARFRAAGAVLALATIPLGLVLASAQLGAVIIILIAMLYTESNGARLRSRVASGP
jgi:low temperature requirement protein LtrA